MKAGFIVNPVAGMGGAVALKGTDGEETLRRAVELGAKPRAAGRAETALREFADAARGTLFLAPSGEMGAGLLTKYGIECETLFETGTRTTAAETRRAAQMMLEHGAELIIFAGGDGTARDVCAAVGDKIPVVGIPAGVKIHSAVYAKRPQEAGKLIKSFLEGRVKRFAEAEVMDIDEEAFREGRVSARLYGYMRVPHDAEFMQERKSGGGAGSAEEPANLAAFLANSMKPGTLYLIGSGSTTMRLKERLGIEGTLLGVDAVKGGAQLGRDLTSEQIKKLLSAESPENRALIITVIGGQGHIFGRGNQQLSPEVIKMLPRENITVAATPAKMAGLFGKSLIADTGDAALDEELKGYVPVVTGHARRMMAKIG